VTEPTQTVAPDSPEAQSAVQGQVTEQAASVAPDTSSIDRVAEDPAAKPAEVDTQALLEQLRALEARVNAAVPVPAEPEPPARTTSQIAPNAGGWLVNVLTQLEDRIEATEVKVGLRDAPEDEDGDKPAGLTNPV
jgi:hypothetical protein